MAFDMTNFIIDRILRGIAVAQGDVMENGKKIISEGDVLFSINQITNPSLSCTSESTDVVDALNVPVATFYRAKNAEFSAENAMFDMNLMATQAGTTKQVSGSAADGKTFEVPMWSTIDVNSTGKATLAHSLTTTQASAAKAYILKGDGTLLDPLKISSASKGRAEIAISGDEVSYSYDATGLGGFTADEQLFIMAEYTANETSGNQAIKITNSAQNFPVGCKFIMEILGYEVCNQTDKIYAYLIFPNAKLSPDFDWSISSDSAHPFSLKAMQDYCKKDKPLFSIVIPE